MYEISLRKMKVFALLFALLAASCSALRVVRLPTRTHRATSKLDAQFQTTQNCARPSAPRNALTAPSPPAGPVGVDGVDAPRRRCRRAPAARCAARRLRGREHLLDQTHEDGEEVGPRLREGAPRRCCPSPSQLSQFRNARTSPRSSPSARCRTAATSSRSARRARRSRSPTRSRAAPCRTSTTAGRRTARRASAGRFRTAVVAIATHSFANSYGITSKRGQDSCHLWTWADPPAKAVSKL